MGLLHMTWNYEILCVSQHVIMKKIYMSLEYLICYQLIANRSVVYVTSHEMG